MVDVRGLHLLHHLEDIPEVEQVAREVFHAVDLMPRLWLFVTEAEKLA
jgi:hypothetical protein